MQLLTYTLFIIEIIVALLMVAVVMLQPPKDASGGISTAFGGGMGEAVFGGRVGNVLTRATIVLGAILVVNTLVITFLMRQDSGSAVDRAAAQQSAPAVPAEQPAQ